MKTTVIASSIAAVVLLAACTPKPMTAEPPAQRANLAYLKRTAAQPVVCNIGADCSEKWARARQWVVAHSQYSIKTDTGTEIATYGPIEPTTDSAYTIVMEQQDSNSNIVTFTSTCGKVLACVPTTLDLKSQFNDFVMYGKSRGGWY